MKYTKEEKSIIETMTPEMLAGLANMIEEHLKDMDDEKFIEEAKANLEFIESVAFEKIAQRMINDGRIVFEKPLTLH